MSEVILGFALGGITSSIVLIVRLLVLRRDAKVIQRRIEKNYKQILDLLEKEIKK